MAELSPALLIAYRSADYIVEAREPFVLNIDQYSTALATLYSAHNSLTAAFITACNPASQVLPAEDNAARQQVLQQVLQDLGLHCLPGRGEDPAGQWPGEDSFLVLGIEKETACGLGRQFGQNAIVFCNSDAVPQLVLL